MANDKGCGAFTLSLDCEGLWGVADVPSVMSSGIITSQSLSDAYEFIYKTLDLNSIRCTAAFVTAFATPRDELRARLPEFEELAQLVPSWFQYLLPRIRKGDFESIDGLEGHKYWKLFASAGHEMGWHGTTHMPLDDSMSAEAISKELNLEFLLSEVSGYRPKSIVFPRNMIGNLAALRSFGFTTYRAKRNSRFESQLFGRIIGVTREFAIWDRGEHAVPSNRDGWCVYPAGFFLNWSGGMRSLVPPYVTILRWRSMLHAAAEAGETIHMWFHPHNLITAPAMRSVFAQIMADVSEMLRDGRLINPTMLEA